MGFRSLAFACFGIFAATTVHSRPNGSIGGNSLVNTTCGVIGLAQGAVDGITLSLYVGVGGDRLSPFSMPGFKVDTFENNFECYVSKHAGVTGRYITRSDVNMYLAIKLDKDVKLTVNITDELTDVPFSKPYTASKTFTGPLENDAIYVVPYENLPDKSHFPCGPYILKQRLIISFDTTGNPTGKGHVMGYQKGVIDFI